MAIDSSVPTFSTWMLRFNPTRVQGSAQKGDLKMKEIFSLFIVVLGLLVSASWADEFNPAEVWAKIDSARKAEESRILTPEMRKGLRECGRSKTQWLKEQRSSKAEFARIDSALTAAKTGNADPRSEGIQSLFEKKFRMEQELESTYANSKNGKACIKREEKHRAAVEAALEKNQQIRAWKEKLERFEKGDLDLKS
jgi:hypothetical protein